MKNIHEIMREFGIEIPTDKQADFNKAVAENYKTIAEHDKKIGKIEAERDAQKERADTAEETLKGFEGIDPAQIQNQLDDYKQRAEKAEKDYADKLYARDFDDALKAAMGEYEFSSTAAKSAIMDEVRREGLKLKDGKIMGLDDVMKTIKARDESAFVNKSLADKQAHFTASAKSTPHVGSAKTYEEIAKIKDRSDRMKEWEKYLISKQKGE